MFQCPVLPELLAMSEDSAQLNSLLKDANLPDHQEVKSFVKDSRDGQGEYNAMLANQQEV